jgi:iron complex outermembrane recepter protein
MMIQYSMVSNDRLCSPATKSQCRCTVRFAVLAALLAGAMNAGAQTPGAELTPTIGLEEILVTARRTEENSQEVPISIAAFSADELVNRRISDVTQLTEQVPGLRVQSSVFGRQSPDFALRGLRSTGVVLYFSEVPGRAESIGREIYDLSSVQVLKGPQGTLFGKNTTAGALLFQPARPSESFEGSATLEAGNFAKTGAEGMINLPISDVLQVRFAGKFVERDGFMNVKGSGDDLDDEHFDSQRVSVLFKPVDAFENLLIYDRFYADEAPSATKLIAALPCPANPTIGQFLTFAACKYVPPLTTALGLPSFNQFVASELPLDEFETTNPSHGVSGDGRALTDSWGVSNLSTVQFGGPWTLRNIFGYREDATLRDMDTDGTVYDLSQVSYDSKYESLSNELQLLAEFDRVKLIVGGFYNRVVYDTFNFLLIASPGPISPIVQDSREETKTKAVFSQATFAVNDRLDLTAGFRYTWENKLVTGTAQTAGRCGFNPPNIAIDFTNCTRRQEEDFGEPSWTVSADYKLTDSALLYATARRGFNSGGFNVAPPVAYDTEKIDDIELGIKTEMELAGQPVRTNLSIYHSEFDGLQRQITRFINNFPTGFVDNASSATVNGAELEINAVVLERLRIDAALSYIDAEYDKFETEVAPNVVADISSNALAQAPEWTSSLTATYSFPVPASFADELLLSGTWSYQGKTYFDDLNATNNALSNRLDPYNEQPSYSIFNAQLSVRDVFGTQATVALFGRNLSDELYATKLSNTLSTFGVAKAYYAEPRTWGVSVNYRFGD